MGYLKEFQTQIANRDFTKFLKLWEEYCCCDEADTAEIISLLNSIKASDFAKPFGPYVEMLLPLWETIKDEKVAYRILTLIVDLETTNSPKLAHLALEGLMKHFGQLSFQDREVQEKLRLVGLRTKEQFQSALSNFELLVHLKKGHFVFHGSGFGVGEVMEVSPLREVATIEFENARATKQITFSSAFKSLIPITNEHFLARRFSNPDEFEKQAKENPVAVIKLLLKDLGPKTAAEIKDELEELVIPEKEWQKWWQNARAKLKKDTEIESPESAKDPFILRTEAVSHESQLLEALKKRTRFDETLLLCYNFIRDYSPKLKIDAIKDEIIRCLESFLKTKKLKEAESVQAYLCLESVQGKKYDAEIREILTQCSSLEALIEQIDIVVYKKLTMAAIKSHLENWPKVFLKLLHTTSQGLIREYLIKELIQNNHKDLLQKEFEHLLHRPWENPELFVWYYLKMMNEPDKDLPFHDKIGKNSFSEALLVLLNRIENDTGQKDLTKKVYIMLTGKRYALVRQIFEDSSLEFVKEFLLLASKCHTLTDHDLKICRSLAEVVHPVLSSGTNKKEQEQTIFWTTEAGLLKMQDYIKKIGTTDVIENARDIEAARALGDLRENSEYKSALERRAHLQRELKRGSHEISLARVLTPADVPADEVGVGSVIYTLDQENQKLKFVIIGPWEANPEAHILSCQSKVGQAMLGLKVGDQFKFKDGVYTIEKLGSIFEEASLC